jgi:PAS domain S-box-containing protein
MMTPDALMPEILKATGHCMPVLHPDGRIVSHCELWPVFTQGQSYNSFIDLMDEPTRALWPAWVDALRKLDAASLPVEMRLRIVDGTFTALRCTLIPDFDGTKTLQKIYLIFPCVQSPQETMTEENQLFELSSDMLGVALVGGVFEKVNPACERILGYTARELAGKSFDEFIHPDDLAPTLAIAQDQPHIPAMLHYENRYRRKDGSYRWLSWNCLVHMPCRRIYFVARDMTERKLTEMHLLLRNQAVEFSPSGVTIADALDPDYPLIYVNPAFLKTTGYRLEELLGRNCRFLQGEDRDQPELNLLRMAIQERRSCTVTLRNYRKNGEMFYNELRIAPIFNLEGELTHFVGITTDVTRRMRDQEKIERQNQALMQANHELQEMRINAEMAAQQIQKQNEELRAANINLAFARQQAEDMAHLKSQFLATMSHELRTPLNAIIGYTEIQLAGMTGEMTEEQNDYQKRVLANADHLLQLINDVLDLSKIEAGRMELVRKSFDIRKWMDEVSDQNVGLAQEKSLQFECFVDERLPPLLIGDPARLKQIAINLLSNAIKFTEKGYVRFEIRRQTADTWTMSVTDTGIGIPSHLLETIFDEFRQVDSTYQRRQGGTGLGLAIVRKLALMMAGNIRVSSQLGEGSTFTLVLPLVVPHEITTERAPYD